MRSVFKPRCPRSPSAACMYRHPSHELYAQNLGTDLAARGGGGGGGRKKQRRRSQSQGRRSQSRSRSQSQSRRSHSRGSMQYSRRRGNGKGGRRGMRDEMVPYYPDHLAAQYGYPPLGFGYPAPHLSHKAQMGDSDQYMWVKNTGGVHRAVPYHNKKKSPKDAKVWNGYAVGPDDHVYVVKGKKMYEPQSDTEKKGAQRYLENSKKSNKKGNQHQDNAQQHRRNPHIAKNDYKVYGAIRSKIDKLSKAAKNESAEFIGYDENILNDATVVANDFVSHIGFFANTHAKKLPIALEYLHKGKSLQGLEFKKGPPKFLSEFDAVLHNADGMSNQAKNKAVFYFMVNLQASIRRLVNSQANQGRKDREDAQFVKAMSEKFFVGVPEGESGAALIKEVAQRCAMKVAGMDAASLKGLKLKEHMFHVIAVQFVLHIASAVKAASDGGNVTYNKLLKYIAASMPSHFDFVKGHEIGFRKAVKNANRVLHKQELPAPGASSAVSAGSVAAAQPGSGLCARLLSMRH
jgi:hypothetical protein